MAERLVRALPNARTAFYSEIYHHYLRRAHGYFGSH
jgi:hypothetical protein